MGLIDGFEYDIFISYAHDDNLGYLVNDPAEGWVLDFAKRLKQDLSRQLKKEIGKAGRDLEIFWDKDSLQQGEPLDWELNDHVENSAIFCIFMSQNYLDSAWCKQELDWFLKTMDTRKDRLMREHAGRLWPVIVVGVGPTAQADWPDSQNVLQRAEPFDFFHANEKSGDPRYAYPSIVINQDRCFYDEFTKLGTMLSRRIKKALEKESAAPAESQDSADEPRSGDIVPYTGDVILLATDDLAQKARRLEAQCHEAGIGAVRAEQFSADALEPVLNSAKAVVAMLGVYPGADEEDKVKAFRTARDVASEMKIPFLPWMQKGLKPAFIDDDFENYKSFVTEMQASLVPGEIGDLVDRLKKETATTTDEPDAAPVERRVKLFIDAAKIDIDIAQQIQEKLRSHSISARTYLPQANADQKAHNEQWNNLVEKCDGIILVSGQIDIDAIDDKLDQILRLSAKRRAVKKAEISVAIIDAPPPSGFYVQEPGVQIITADDEMGFSGIVEFIKGLQTEGGSNAAA